MQILLEPICHGFRNSSLTIISTKWNSIKIKKIITNRFKFNIEFGPRYYKLFGDNITLCALVSKLIAVYKLRF